MRACDSSKERKERKLCRSNHFISFTWSALVVFSFLSLRNPFLHGQSKEREGNDHLSATCFLLFVGGWRSFLSFFFVLTVWRKDMSGQNDSLSFHPLWAINRKGKREAHNVKMKWKEFVFQSAHAFLFIFWQPSNRIISSSTNN